MSSRTWSTIVAAGIVALFACLASAQESQPQGIGENQEAGQEVQEDRTGEPAVEVPIASPVEAPQTDLPADHPEQDDQPLEEEQVPESVFDWSAFVSSKDTLAQWIMAAFGVIATGISIAAVVLLKRTLEATRHAVVQTEQATVATMEAVEIARAAYVTEHRTWLKVFPASIGPVRFNGDRISVHIELVAENIGNSPALEVHLNVEAFRGKGFGTGPDAEEEVAFRTKEVHSKLPYGQAIGSVLMRGEKTQRWGFSVDAMPHPRIEALERDQSARGAKPFRQVSISVVYCVIYKTIGYPEWHYTCRTVFLGKKDMTDFLPELGDVSKKEVNATLVGAGSWK